MPDFETYFEQLTGKQPFPWQIELFNKFLQGEIPKLCQLPTGVGKTSVIPIWLIALAIQAKVPRRLVYVVNRRTVVDQTTNEIEKIRRKLLNGYCPEIALQLRSLCAFKTDVPLGVSTLRGQFADNQEWAADPARPAVICGTVDMIGSRLLFSGYRIGFKSRPLHAGFLGQDSLIVHDEAHLEPAFQTLLETIEKEQKRCQDLSPCSVMQLTATTRTVSIPSQQQAQSSNEEFELTDGERQPQEISATPQPGEPPIHVVWRRLIAKKSIELHSVENEKSVPAKVAELAQGHRDANVAVLIFVRTIDDVQKVFDKLTDKKKGIDSKQVQLLTGTMRGLERDKLVDDDPVFQRFLPREKRIPDKEPQSGTVYLISTSAGEVGVDLSADHLVGDLSTYESMAQRFGRVNRNGERTDARIDVVYSEKLNDKDVLTPPRKTTLELLKKLNKDASPLRLRNLSENNPDLVKAAYSPEPDTLPATDILFDSWALTSIRKKMPGRPPVEPYLHGIQEWEPPVTKVAWREEVGRIVDDLLDDHPTEDLLDLYPLKPHELLQDRTDRVWKELAQIATRHPDAPLWIVDEVGQVEIIPELKILAELPKKIAEGRIAGKTVLLPHNVGGLTHQGMLDGTLPSPETEEGLDVADEWEGPGKDGQVVQMRKRMLVTVNNEDAVPNLPNSPSGMKLIRTVKLTTPSDEDNEEEDQEQIWYWFTRVMASETDARSKMPYCLTKHLDDAERIAASIVEKLPLSDDLKSAVVLAAKNHDIGKDREHWQSSIGNRKYPNEKWAKSGERRGSIEQLPYRHEFGSLLDLQSQPEFQALANDMQDLVLHLIAAHHGRARPHFTPEEIIDLQSSSEAAFSESVEVPRRFARLQRKYGRWGLAYLESLVRAVDYAASALANDSKGAAI